MSEVKTTVQTMLVEMRCFNCGVGFMRPTRRKSLDISIGISILHWHRCEDCGAKTAFYKKYPAIEYKKDH